MTPTPKKETTPLKPQEPVPDRVEETSEESFPASDAPSWTPVVGEQGADPKQDLPRDNPATKGCTTSFILEEREESGGACDELHPDPSEQYVQPDKEREAGGEGGS